MGKGLDDADYDDNSGNEEDNDDNANDEWWKC